MAMSPTGSRSPLNAPSFLGILMRFSGRPKLCTMAVSNFMCREFQ